MPLSGSFRSGGLAKGVAFLKMEHALLCEDMPI